MEYVKRKDVKPALKKSEQTRHQTAAQYFLAGAQPFLIEQEIQIRKYVNTDILKDNIVKECKKKFDAMKQSLAERADDVRKKATSDFEKVLNNLLLLGGAAVIALNTLSSQLIALVKKYGSGVYDGLTDELNQAKIEGLRAVDSVEQQVREHAKVFGKLLFKYIDIFFNRIEGNVFEEMLMIGAQKAGERANGAMWLILKAFGAFIHRDVRKRPLLEDFLKFGPKVSSEINRFELEFRNMTHHLLNFQGVKARVTVRQRIIEVDGEDWYDAGFKDVEQIVNIGGEVQERITQQMYELDDKVLAISEGIASEITVENVFSQIKSPSETESYRAAVALIQQTTLDRGRNVPTVLAADLIIPQMPDVYKEACQRIERYIEANKDRYDEAYTMIVREYTALMGDGNTIRRKSDVERFYLVRWILYSVIMDQRKQELQRMTLGSIEQQNYRADTFLNRTLSRMRSVNESNESQIDVINSDLRAGRISAEQFVAKIDQIFADFENNHKIFKNLINRNDVHNTFTPYRIINQINLLRVAIQQASQVQQGAESSGIHNMNGYGLGGYSASAYDNDGRIYEHNRELHADRNQIIPIQEANERLTEEYIILRQNIIAGRRRRKELVSQFLESVEELKDIRIRLEQASAS